MDSNHFLSLLGLCLRGGNLAVGEEPVEAEARAKHARVLLLASDAAENTARRVKRFAEMGACVWLRVPFTKAELGRAAGRTSAALLAVTDIGLANAAVRKLAELDPKRYGEAADKLEGKAKRAAARKEEQLAHEKNLQKGIRKKRPPVEMEPIEEAPPPPKPEKRSPQAAQRRKPPANRPAGSGEPRRPTAGRPTRSGVRKPAGDRPTRSGAGKPAGDRPPQSGVRKPAGDHPTRSGTWRKPSESRPARSGEPRKPSAGRPSMGGSAARSSRPTKDNRPKPRGKPNPYAHSRPVKKGKGSVRKKES